MANISFAVSPSGAGNVVWQAGIIGGTGGTAVLEAGNLTVSAIANIGFQFVMWSASNGTMQSATNPLTFQIASRTEVFTLTAVFTSVNAAPRSGTNPTTGGSAPLPQDNFDVGSNINAFGFSKRLLEDLPIPADELQALGILFLMWKDRPMLESIIKQYFKVLESTMGHLAQGATANLITAWTHPILIANILEHNYMIASGAAGGMEASTQWIAGAMTASNVLSAVFGGKGFDVPSTLILAGVGNAETAERLHAAHGQPETRRSGGASEKRNVDTSPHAKAVEAPPT